MFKTNNQPGLFSFENELGRKQRNVLEGSKEKWFYYLILRNINEMHFRELYSDKASRPNAPVNKLVSALILKELKGIIYDELMVNTACWKNPARDLQDALDRAVSKAYGFNEKGGLLEQLLNLNFKIAEREQNGEPVQKPGLPDWFEDKEKLISDDCVRLEG